MSIEVGSSFTIRTTIKIPVTLGLATPSSVSIMINNPDDTAYLAYTTMILESEGVYTYILTLAADAQLGAYCGNIKSVSSGGYVDIERFSFVAIAATCVI